MGLNIKNQRVHQLAKRAAQVTGLTMTGAIEAGLERLLTDYGEDAEQVRAAARIDLVHTLVAAYCSDPGDTNPLITSVEDLFDEAGLPR